MSENNLSNTDKAGNTIVRTDDGRRSFKLTQRKYKPLETIGLVITAPLLLIKVAIWANRGCPEDEADFTIVAPSGDWIANSKGPMHDN